MMPRLGGDLVGALKAAADGDLGDVRLEWRRESCVAVVLASAGYPGRYATGHPIRGLTAAEELEGVAVFQAGTRLDGDSTVTHGGRVLAVSALGPDLLRGDALPPGYRPRGRAGAGGRMSARRATRAKPASGRATADSTSPRVGIVMGSDSDGDVMFEAARALEEFGVPYEAQVLSAHRSPARAHRYARDARRRGLQVIIAGAGGAAHLAGVMAAGTTLPVLAVPLAATPLAGFDALLASVQMPGGIPVGTLAVGKMGSKNAGLLAVQILALQDPSLAQALERYRADMEKSVTAKSRRLRARMDVLRKG